MSQRIKHKVGDTFDAAGVLKNAQGTPVNLTTSGITLTSAMRLDRKVFAANCTILDQTAYPGQFQVSAETVTWPAEEELDWDVQFKQGGHTISTQTIRIVTLPDVTPAA